jgi:protein TonB
MLQQWSLGMNRPASTPGLGPSTSGPERIAPLQIRGAEALGADWRNAFSAWVEQHKYYPQQAIINGEDGSPEVEMVIRRDGKVLSVELETRSGSQWLDIALQALFRGRQLPPFPPNAKDDEVTVHFTMHYILIRR